MKLNKEIENKLLAYLDEDSLEFYGDNAEEVLITALGIIKNDGNTKWEDVYCSREIDILCLTISTIIEFIQKGDLQ